MSHAGHADLLATLAQRLGAEHVLPGGQWPAYERDWRQRWHGRALAVVRPASTDEVAQVLRLCAEHRVSVVPQGGNTGLVGGGVPDASGQQLLLSLQRLNRLRALDAANLTLTAEAGMVLQAVQQAATDAGLLFPLSLAAEGSCTLGGNLATNAGGTQVLRYGNARELCLGLEVVTAAGEVWDGLRGLRKDNTGYDLRHLLIGSEGTLGVITAATMKLYPQPAARITAMLSTASLTACVALLGLAQRQLGAGLTAFEVMNRLSLDLVRRHLPQLRQPLPPSPWTVLIEYSAQDEAGAAQPLVESLLDQALGQGLIDDAALAASLAQARAMWHVRESISLAQSQEGLNIKHDIALPVSAIPEFCAHTEDQLTRQWRGARLVNFGHLGDGNLHFNVQCPQGADAAEFLARCEPGINTLVFDAVQRWGGSISAEHGIGQLKREELAQRQSPVARRMMQALKQALDPQGLLNPGRLL